ncbi:hypothetical protein ACWFNE_04760 [Cellulomonas sp. NPDC055163]
MAAGPGLGLFAVVVMVLTLVPAVALVVGGLATRRRSTTAGLVPVEAVVVDFSNATRSNRVTFDYPAPDGSWLRATRVEGVSTVRRSGLLVHPGDRLTVYVDPARPADVRLSQGGSAAGLAGPVMVVAGIVWGVVGVVFLFAVLLLARSAS